MQDLVERNLVRVLDMLFLRKNAEGELEIPEISDLDTSELGEIRTAEAELAMVLSEQDLEDLATTIEPGTSAAVLVWENLWAAPFGVAVRQAGGQLVASGRIPPKRCWPRSRPTPRKEPDMPMAAPRRRRTAAAVGGAIVVAHGVNRRGDRREDRRDDRGDRREDRRDRRD